MTIFPPLSAGLMTISGLFFNEAIAWNFDFKFFLNLFLVFFFYLISSLVLNLYMCPKRDPVLSGESIQN